jgi:Putative adipose-regulatory protein (Seipin)
MEVPRDSESIRRVLEQAARAAYRRAQAQMENMNIQDAQNVRRLLEYAATEAIARAQEFEIPMAAFHSQAVGAMEGTFIGLWPILRRMLIYYSIGMSLLVSSIGMYGMFYVSIQPGQAASEPLFFDYAGIAKHPAPQIECVDQIDSCPAHFLSEHLGNTPWAAADFFSRHTQWEAHHTDVMPTPRVRSRALQPGKGYFFEVALELPESNINRDTGMFMVHVHLQSSNGTMLASSVRPARLPLESLWIATIRKSVWLIPMIIGAAHEVRVLVVPSFRHFRESATFPLVRDEMELSSNGCLSSLISRPIISMCSNMRLCLWLYKRKTVSLEERHSLK